VGEADFRVAGRNFCDTRLGGSGLGTIWSKGTLLTSVCPTFLMGACLSLPKSPYILKSRDNQCERERQRLAKSRRSLIAKSA
jgi:hypothetical protein